MSRLLNKIYDSKLDRVKKICFFAEIVFYEFCDWKESIWDNDMDAPATPHYFPEGVTVRQVVERKHPDER